MKPLSLKFILILLLILIPFSARANMVWPSIFIVQQYYTWYVILIGLIVEFFAVKIFLKVGWGKAAIIDVSMNAISALIGVLLIPASGIFVEFLTVPFGATTFHLSHWILDYVAAVLSNVVIEGLALKWIFKYPFKKNFLWLLGANAISVIICTAVPMPTYMNESAPIII